MKVETGFYGKLPIAGDFIRMANASAAAQDLTRWLDRSERASTVDLSKLSGGEVAPDHLHLLLYSAKQQLSFAAVCMPSKDTSGRRFPFLVYAEASKPNLSHWHLFPGSFELFFNVAAKQVNELPAGFAPGSEHSTMLKLQSVIPVDETQPSGMLQAYMKDTTLEKLNESLSRSHGPDILSKTMWQLFGSLEYLSTGLPPNFQAIFRYPLSGQGSASKEIGFWYLVTETILAFKLSAPSICWTRGHVDFCLGDMLDTDLGRIWREDSVDERIWEFKRMNMSNSSIQAERRELLTSALANPQCTLTQFLHLLSGRGGRS